MGYLFSATFVLWVIIGAVWLLPQKIALLRRVGNLTNAELIALAKTGDKEAQRLWHRGRWYCGIGLVLILLQAVLVQVLKSHS